MTTEAEPTGPEGVSPTRWQERISDATSVERKWRDAGREVVKIYRAEKTADGGEGRGRFNMLFANTSILFPSVYQQAPQADVRRRFQTPDAMADAASSIVQGALNAAFDAGNLDAEIRRAVQEVLLPGRGTIRVRWAPVVEEQPVLDAMGQGAANKEAITESARVNAVDQYGPQGSTTYQRGADGVPISQTVSLTPTGQQTYNQQEQIAAGLTDKAATLAGRIPTGPMDLSGVPARQTGLSTSGLPSIQGVGDFGADAQRTQDATFQKAQALLQPGQKLDRSRLEQQLSDRGIPLDSAAGQAELTRMEASQSEANNRAAYDAVAAGGAEQSRLFGLSSSARGQLFGEGLTSANFTNDQRTSSLQEALTLRNQDFNEASALLQGAPVMGSPSFMNTPTYNMQPVDVAGITQQGYQNQLAASQASNPMNGLFGLGSAAITKWSDRRLKRDIIPLGTGWRGLPLFAFRYAWGGAHEIGVMAQDVARVAPAAVIRTASGFLAVDYGKLRAEAA